MEYVKSGKIGKLYMAKAWDVQLRDDIGHKEDSAVPPGVDYDTWTGPALLLPFNENRFHYNWHWNWNYGTGDMGNDGVHQLDIARWALGVDYPVQAPNGVIHRMTSMNHPSMHFAMNEAWILSDEKGEVNQQVANSQSKVRKQEEKYPDGKIKALGAGEQAQTAFTCGTGKKVGFTPTGKRSTK